MTAKLFLLVVVVSAALLGTERTFAQSVAYDNTATYLGTAQSPHPEDGSEITLMGTLQVVTSVAIAVEIAGETPATAHAQLRLYANDGPIQGGSPWTLLWKSDVIDQQIEPGGPRFIEFAVPSIHVPKTFTWTATLGTGSQVYFSQFYPPVVGSVRYGYWLNLPGPPPGSGWVFIDSVAPFGAVVTAEPEIPAISPWGAMLLTLGLVCAGTVLLQRANKRGSPGRTVGAAALVSALGFFAWGSSASAQVDVGPQIRIDVGGGSKAASETSIASSNVNANVIVAAWNDWRESTPNEEKVRIGVAVSNDGGANWSDFLIHAQETIESIIECDPMTAYDDRTGTLWVGGIAAGGNGGVFVTSKIPGQAAFVDPPIIAYERNDDDPYGAVDKGWMAAGPRPGYPEETNVYIVFIRVMPFYQGVIVRSMDMGVHWSLMGEDWEPEPYALATADAFLPRVGPNGEVYVVYSGPSAAPPRDKGIYLRRSFNGGESFGEEITIATFIDTWLFSDNLAISGTFRAPSFSYFAVDQNNGTLYCVYFDTTNFVGGNRNVDLYFTKSTNQGATGSWTTPVVINGDGDPPGDQFFPWIEVDEESNLHMVFLDSRHTVQDDDEEHGMLDAYYSFSNDGGATWQEFRLTEDSFDSDDDGLNWLTGEQVLGDYMGLGRSQDQVYPCYPSTQDGDTDIYTHVITVLGGCCVDDSCDLVSRESCESQNGTFLGAGKTCTLPDCNCNGAADPCDIANATSEDLDDNGVPDECDDKGACCLSYDPNDCVMTPTSECCDALHGVYWYEPHAKCETTDCSQAPMQPQP